jgi:hypothetical protein
MPSFAVMLPEGETPWILQPVGDRDDDDRYVALPFRRTRLSRKRRLLCARVRQGRIDACTA